MRYTANTTKTLSVVFGVMLLFTLSCKTKKVTVQTPVASQVTETDNELNSIKKDLPKNQVERTNEGIKFTFSNEILFPINSSYLNENSSNSIAAVARVIKEKGIGREVLVEGHSDKTGTSEYNQWLSEKRAVSVKNQLVKLGIAAGRIKTAGIGDTNPIADNKTKEGRLINRRVEVTLLKNY